MATEQPRALTQEEAILAGAIVWVGQLACGCRPFSVVESDGVPMSATDDAFGTLLGQSARVEVYSVEDAARIVAPCTHNVVPAGAAS